MARAGRSFEEGRIYHVYNRVGGGSKAFVGEEPAAELGKSRGGVSHWYRRGVARRTEDADFAAVAEALDQGASEEP